MTAKTAAIYLILILQSFASFLTWAFFPPRSQSSASSSSLISAQSGGHHHSSRPLQVDLPSVCENIQKVDQR